MANEFITPTLVAREALMVLKNNMVMANLISRDWDNEFREEGDTVMVRRPATFEAKTFDPVTGIEIQNAVEGKVPVTLDTILDVSFAITSKELTLDIRNFSQQLIAPAVNAIQQRIDEKICGLYKDVPYYVGTAGTTPSGVADITAIRKLMNDNKVPMDGRVAVLDTSADAKLLELDTFHTMSTTGETDAIINARLGRKFGFDFYMDQNICNHENGVSGGIGASTAAALLKDDNTVNVTGLTLVGTATDIKAGTVFTFAGDSQPYTVQEDATVTGGSATIKFYPAARMDFTASTAVTILDDHAASLAFHKNAFTMVTRPLAKPMGTAGENYAVISDPLSGVSLRVVFGYDIKLKRDICSIDMLCGFKTMIPELACRILG